MQVLLALFLNGLLKVLQTIVLSHGLGDEVGVAAYTIPGPRNGLRITGCCHSKVFKYMPQDEMGRPEMMSHIHSFTGSYLEFPPSRNDLGILSLKS